MSVSSKFAAETEALVQGTTCCDSPEEDEAQATRKWEELTPQPLDLSCVHVRTISTGRPHTRTERSPGSFGKGCHLHWALETMQLLSGLGAEKGREVGPARARTAAA